MKVKISEQLDMKAVDGLNPMEPDELARQRIRRAALQKAGFTQAGPKRRIGKRAAVVLIAALAAVLMFATALATTDLGARLAGMFRGEGFGILDTVGQLGQSVDVSATDQDITITIEAAYTNAIENLLVLTIEDAQDRLSSGMWLLTEILDSDNQFSVSRQYAPELGDDGKYHTILTMEGDKRLQGGNVRLAVSGITPNTVSVDDKPMGFTVKALMEMKMPIAIPGVDDAFIAAVNLEPGGLLIAGEYEEWTRNGQLSLDGFALRQTDGTLIQSERRVTIYANEDEEDAMNRMECAFLRESIDPDVLLDCEVLISYSIRAPEIEGNWMLDFRMPRDDRVTVHSAIGERISVQDRDFTIEAVTLYSSCVVIEYTAHPYDHEGWDSSEPTASELSIFDNWDDPFPEFELVSAKGVMIAANGGARLIEDHSGDGPLGYRTTIHCLADRQDSIVLRVKDNMDGHELMKVDLK